MAAHELASLLGCLLRKGLDILIPSHHGIVALGTEYPGMPTVHTACLATLEDELVRGTSFVRVGSYFLFWKIK